MTKFTHLHVHTQYSILDGAASIDLLMNKAVANNMDAMAITDHGNMYGVLDFVNEAKKKNIKPIIGCETYVSHNTRFDKKSKDDRSGYHLILLAKNLEGYKNLSRLVSLGYKEGFYYKPRIDKDILKQYSTGLIASTACLGGEIPYYILNYGMDAVRRQLEDYLLIFKDDLYLELMRHDIDDQAKVNKELISLSKEYGIKLIATNDVHFVDAQDHEAHTVLLNLNTKRDMDDEKRLIYTGNEYLKTPEEMLELFADVPEAIANTQEVSDKIEKYDLTRSIILPIFPIPGQCQTEDDYLKDLTYKGAKAKYGEIDEALQTRIDYELKSIADMKFPGYFLIVEDFVRKAKQMGVMVGPGRGSAAGSVIAYCLDITNIDPIKYNLIFERFLNPERISFPDIDIDFDDEGREKVLNYVTEKYGKDKVAQIITFGKMGPKLAIRDVARVMNLPLAEADKLAKLIPETVGTTLEKAYKSVSELAEAKKNGSDLVKRVLKLAEVLEGSVRQVGTHACGVIIGTNDLIDIVPLSTSKDSELMVTQYEGKLTESIGLLKMDFLGLKTLSIIKDALENIKKSKHITIDLDKIPMNDEKAIGLFTEGNTVGIFQFESDGMQTYMKSLKPNDLEDLIAMNALYRPGPMNNIPSYINRKHQKEKVDYPHPIIEDILKPTYGIMIYQEQIMQISQKMANFSGGKADELRKAMGKKKKDIVERLKVEFLEGAKSNNVDKKIAEDVYETMAKFAEYGFNRSHSAAYSVLAYQTGYLKAHHPAEYMAAVLTHNLSDIKKITFYIEECKRAGIQVLGPDINESESKFTVNSKGQIRFGMVAIKNVGENAVTEIIAERNKAGDFKNIFDLTMRVNLRSLNKKSIESLAIAGAFDCFEGTHRAQYFYQKTSDEPSFIEKVIKYSGNYQNSKLLNQNSLFGDASDSIDTGHFDYPECERWSNIEQLKKEKEVIGFYISGHPLDEYRTEIDNYCNSEIEKLKLNSDLMKLYGSEVRFAAIVTVAAQKLTKKGDPFGAITFEDYNDSFNMNLFNEDYLKFKHFFEPGRFLYIKAKVQKRYNADDQFELKIISICLLSDVLDKQTNSISVFLPLLQLNEVVISSLNEIIMSNSGKCRLKFIVQDEENKISIDMHANKFKVNSSGFIKNLKESLELKFKLN